MIDFFLDFWIFGIPILVFGIWNLDFWIFGFLEFQFWFLEFGFPILDFGFSYITYGAAGGQQFCWSVDVADMLESHKKPLRSLT